MYGRWSSDGYPKRWTYHRPGSRPYGPFGEKQVDGIEAKVADGFLLSPMPPDHVDYDNWTSADWADYEVKEKGDIRMVLLIGKAAELPTSGQKPNDINGAGASDGDDENPLWTTESTAKPPAETATDDLAPQLPAVEPP